MTDSTVELADFSGIAATHSLAEEAERRRNIRRAITAAIVAALHVLALSVFIYSSHIPLVVRLKTTVPEAIWILLPKEKVPQPRLENPQLLPEPTIPYLPAPITLPPIAPNRPSPSLAPPEVGTLKGVGHSLACGASLYEYLTPLEREQCVRHPWASIRRPDGTIRLAPPSKDEEPPPSIADIMRHEQQTAPPCPVLSNVPCLGKIMHGDPLGGGPSPF